MSANTNANTNADTNKTSEGSTSHDNSKDTGHSTSSGTATSAAKATAPSSSAAPDASSTNALTKHAKEAAVHVAEQAVDQAKEKVGKQLSERTKRSVGEISNVAKALKHTSEELGHNIASPVIGRAADQIQKASDFLENASMNDVVGSVQSFAKREPILFLGGAFMVGMLGARFLKSSSHHAVPGSTKTSARPTSGLGANERRRAPTRSPAASSTSSSSSAGASQPASASTASTGRS